MLSPDLYYHHQCREQSLAHHLPLQVSGDVQHQHSSLYWKDLVWSKRKMFGSAVSVSKAMQRPGDQVFPVLSPPYWVGLEDSAYNTRCSTKARKPVYEHSCPNETFKGERRIMQEWH